MRAILLVLVAFAAVDIAHADEPNWVRVATAEDHGFMIFIDTNSVALREGHLTARYLWNYSEIQTDTVTHKPYQSEAGLGIYNCQTSQTGAKEYTLYSERGARGNVVDRRHTAPHAVINLIVVEPGSIGEDEMIFVCDQWEKHHSAPAAQPPQAKPSATPLRGALS